jgi:hypothetical protein
VTTDVQPDASAPFYQQQQFEQQVRFIVRLFLNRLLTLTTDNK